HLDPVKNVCSRIDPKAELTLPIESDVQDPKAIEGAIKKAINKFGRLDFAVNNAGITGTAGIPIQDVDIDVWREVIDIDLSGIFYCMKYEIPAILSAGDGAIVNKSYANRCVGLAVISAYTTAKHGVIVITNYPAIELADTKIR